MDIVERQLLQFVQYLIGRESAVGVHAQFNAVTAVAVPQTANKRHFIGEIDGSNLDFHTGEALSEFLLQTFSHRIKITHPH